ncbi:MAG: Calx-beta domain-containing protein, partial [Thermoplasmatota archaeon]
LHYTADYPQTDPAARDRRAAVLRVPVGLRGPADVFTCADDLVNAAESEATTLSETRDIAEREALETAMGAGGTGKGTAAATSDYSAVPLTAVTFAPGETAKTVAVAVTGDTAPEANETLNLVLSSPTGATIADATGTATIVNDDGSAYLRVDDPSVTEGNSGTTVATFTLTRSGNIGGSSTVKV